ncbi:hypothetical protein HY857_01845 [Candidatus Saccharibacteria bacterium]|nr:hypothetical protein [Candidatus Saccharibacteria bacterium]
MPPLKMAPGAHYELADSPIPEDLQAQVAVGSLHPFEVSDSGDHVFVPPGMEPSMAVAAYMYETENFAPVVANYDTDFNAASHNTKSEGLVRTSESEGRKGNIAKRIARILRRNG